MAKSLRSFIFFFGLCLMTMFLFAGCSSDLSAFKDNPQKDDIVYGNGSLAVTKGDYLYFVNGYTGYNSVGDTNYDGKITYSALYRIKLEDGYPVSVEAKLDEDGNEIFDGSRALKNVDVLARKVAGFEFMGLYIFGDYIYYTSPYNGKDGSLTVLSSRVDFFRIKLDRSSGSEHIYTSEKSGTEVKFSMIEVDGNACLTILDGQNLVAIKYDSKNQKTQKTISKDVTSVAFASYTQSNQVVSAFNKDVYFTRALNDEDDEQDGNVLCKFNLSNFGLSDKIYADDNSTITLKQASQDALYYEKNTTQNTTAAFYVTGIVGDEKVENNINTSKEKQIAPKYSDYVLTSNSETLLANDGSNLLLLNHPTYTDTITLFSGEAKIFGVDGDYVYFSDNPNTAIKRVNFLNYARYIKGEITEVPSVEVVVSSKATTGQKNYAVVHNDRLFYLSSDHTNGSKYLHMVDLTSSEFKDYFVGVLEEADYDQEESDE